ncbi:hypothetical protein BV25DRAFT_1820337 [Artomyces pyxidatus]|uniref:Uncharacterized protein n=1 Tax=Artomyces pyxidatus TaxID=48021 RepID=A0ACB8TD53_9AGAM|nr:hypothetical protein BV25DRAFT_1820337 [Artomyces pyxidatus]
MILHIPIIPHRKRSEPLPRSKPAVSTPWDAHTSLSREYIPTTPSRNHVPRAFISPASPSSVSASHFTSPNLPLGYSRPLPPSPPPKLSPLSAPRAPSIPRQLGYISNPSFPGNILPADILAQLCSCYTPHPALARPRSVRGGLSRGRNSRTTTLHQGTQAQRFHAVSSKSPPLLSRSMPGRVP